uniref:EF-hand domain-containing protein n=1 Tax=Bicosoecida sp. CB-2014 TaxID=1486930 RepID=A0A7S1GD85_9STRA
MAAEGKMAVEDFSDEDDDFDLLKQAVTDSFNKYDADNSGAIDAKEFKNLMEDIGEELEDAELEAALKKMDKDGSGKIELDEFIKWWEDEDA